MFNFVQQLYVRIILGLRWVGRQSIWAPGAIPASDWKYRNVKRMFFPFLDACLVYAGRSGLHNGIPSVGIFFPDVLLDTYSRILIYVGFVTLVGAIFPRLWIPDLIANYVVASCLVLYCLCLAALSGAGDDARGFITPIAFMALAGIGFRISILLSEWSTRRVQKARQTAINSALKGGAKK